MSAWLTVSEGKTVKGCNVIRAFIGLMKASRTRRHYRRHYKPATEGKNLDPDNLLWKQYLVYVDLFKFYVDITWKATTWFYVITGAILVYYFDHISDENLFLRYSLFLPFILSLGFFLIYGRGLRETLELETDLQYIAEHLELPGKPHVDILGRFLIAASVLFLLTALGLLYVFWLSFSTVPG
jgi:hypothetical protein